MEKIEKKTYMVADIAQIMGLSMRGAYDFCAAHATDFRVMRIGKAAIRIHKESFDNWFNGTNVERYEAIK
ncbi:MAG: helix-turn-helix domain-containing protein [Clostridia bacterium]|nr:helix-turn-helix domain-containing protein [Clostridia bacterium]